MTDPNPGGERVGTYLTPEEAQEIHKGFMSTFTLYVVIALVAHALMWAYKPWIGGGFGL
ncbi:light-harvesting complex 1 beta chain [Erythrobacter litoralis]|jgi:light-harvesting complex 1 beta chain|uniref:light-harvesting antenna LH1, beta subunit n=1 Tax=Erythrobacter TaxID=1041 RepID=UPI000863A03D|nr:light-harvesting antenna LH1, beta subunit [Erythrobacter litoralis]AOL22857.1 light-harvesting complex 1 beta chain [Erythrobacter litoralis]MEE4207273.1 light-harvesting antenna LH1, beta subunit [Erythrobacter sp.]MEE4338636.1 light-harvesting antenna LH1, beta subunit [Erythrobacter sp.]